MSLINSFDHDVEILFEGNRFIAYAGQEFFSNDPLLMAAAENALGAKQSSAQKPVSKMTKDELLAYALQLGLSLNPESTKDEMINVIKSSLGEN